MTNIFKYNKPIYIVFLLIFFVLGYGENHNPFFFSHLGVKDGLSQVSVITIFQDSDGYIWFGTRNGANRYDGYEFKIYRNEVNNPASISDNDIRKISEDREKNIWIGTSNGINRIDYKTQEITRFYPQTPNKAIAGLFLHSDGELYAMTSRNVFRCGPGKSFEEMPWLNDTGITIQSVVQDQEGDIYIGSGNKGLYIFASDWKLKKHYLPDNTDNPRTLQSGMITALFAGVPNLILIGTHENGVFVYDKDKQSFTRLNTGNSKLSNNSVRDFSAFGKDSVLVGTFQGLNILNVKDMSVHPLLTDMRMQGALSHYSVHSMLTDRSQTLWVGTYSAGVNYHSPFHQPSQFIQPNAFTGIVGMGQEDKDGNMWFATEGAGLLSYNPGNGEQTLYPIKALQEGNYDINILKAILIRGDSILCTTHFGSVYLFSIRNKQYKKIHDYRYNDIYTIYIDSKQRLWIPTNTSDYTVLVDKGKTNNRFNVNGRTEALKGLCVINEIEPDRFLLGTITDSIYMYDMDKEVATDVTHRLKKGNENKRLGSISGILKGAKEDLWIATTKGGLFRLDKQLNLIHNYQKEDGLADSFISSIAIDRNGDIWVVTGKELYKLNPQNNKFEQEDLFDSYRQEYTVFANNAVSKDGTLYFSGNQGILAVNPHKKVINPYIPPVYITSLLINNPDTPEGLTAQQELLPLQYNNNITLGHNQGNIIIRYSALNFIHSGNNEYAYKMEAVEQNWNNAGNRREAYYNNLSPGKYVFRVKASNNDRIWNPQEATLHITIQPPFYKTWWAYLGYACLFVLTTVLIIRRQRIKDERKREEKYIRMEQKRMNELQAERMLMFTNFSHELRTPLTLIINQLKDILQRVAFSPEVKKALRSTKKNTDRMLVLVNNLMDIQKYEAGKTILQKNRMDFSAFIRKTVQSFESVANNREIGFTLDNKLPESFLTFYDETEIEKVFFNLLSNAFKFTPSGGKITIRIRRVAGTECEQLPVFHKNDSFKPVENSYLYIEVEDTGKGFNQDDADKIFKPFFRGEDDIHKQIAGTGIGLSLTRSIVLQHQGYIWVESSKNRGTNFRLLLPDTEKQEKLTDELIAQPVTETQKKVALLLEETETLDRKTILFVDDNQEVLEYLEQQLRHDYIILKAANGKEALRQIEQTEPHIVISDIMMPEMNGLELCRRIKESQDLCHIPVILLTAKSLVSQIEEGLEAGADDYIVKPFYVSLLKARVRSILALRDKIKNTSDDSLTLKQLGIEMPAEDNTFLNRYIEIVKSNISNQELDVAVIYQTLGMSRANFYRKVKEATGLSPIELIRNIRLQAASKLLAESDMNVSEVAQHVGFSSRSYFARSFKAVYGISPTTYQEKQNDSNDEGREKT